MYDRWVKTINPQMPDIPKPENPINAGNPLIIGNDPQNIPMSFVNGDGSWSGFDTEFVQRLALFLNMDYQFESLYYDALFPAVETEKLDLAVGNLDKTPERAETMLFSDDYIDCPAGIGSGFETAVAPADRAVLVANAEPLSVRSCNKVRAKLQYCSVNDISLIINRFNERKFRRMDVYEDLDAVIDEAGARLLGVVPDDGTAASASQKGLPVEGRMKASFAFDRIAARLDGKDVPLLIE